MEKSVNSLAKHGHALADRAADSADDLRGDAAHLIKRVAGQAQSLGKQGYDVVSDAAEQVSEAAEYASDSIIKYTKKNPVKALVIAAATGALLLTVVRALTPSRD